MSTSFQPSPSFHAAAAYLSSAPALNSVANTIKLELYGIFKYLTVAPTPNTPKPSLFDFAGKAKWDAWHAAGQTYPQRSSDAENRYLEIARSLGWVEGQNSAVAEQKQKETGDEEDIWDSSDSESEEPGQSGGRAKASGGGMGNVTSTLAPDDEDEDSGGTTELHRLCLTGDVDGLAKYLSQHPGYDLNGRDTNGYTPLHLATDRGQLAVVKILLEKGVDTTLKDEDEYTAAELAEIAGHKDIANLLASPPP